MPATTASVACSKWSAPPRWTAGAVGCFRTSPTGWPRIGWGAMMLVPTRADRSPIHGVGLFAVSTVRTGTAVWRFEAGFDRTFRTAAVAGLPELARRHVEHYGFLDAARGCWVLNGDLGIFMNHSATPNTGAPGVAGAAEETVALRDIAAGEELTCDYRAFDAGCKPVGP